MTETKKFSDRYTLKEELGRGAFSIVYRCIEKSTSKEYAAKCIKKDKATKRDLQKLESEARICKKLNHANIVRLHRVISEPKIHYFVFDLVTGGELFDDLVAQTDSYTEELTAKCMVQILDTMRYIHVMGVVHRDMKPENVLLESKEKKIIKVADFGLSVEVADDEYKWFGLAGTPNYMAPEVLEMKPYGRPVDMWACGVMMYIMLVGYQPFNHNEERKLHSSIKNGDYEMSSGSWKTVTAEGKDLITKLMCVVPTRRLTASQALDHPWFKKVKVSKKVHRQETVEKLKQFNAKRRFKAAVHSSIFLQTFLTGEDDESEKSDKSEKERKHVKGTNLFQDISYLSLSSSKIPKKSSPNLQETPGKHREPQSNAIADRMEPPRQQSPSLSSSSPSSSEYDISVTTYDTKKKNEDGSEHNDRSGLSSSSSSIVSPSVKTTKNNKATEGGKWFKK